eukprot:TRINITY_DN5351_c0_g1_i1.p1 TRINITY_DN5351_c0_g1~~TRINITY_DN5351_c0_g1_i1.p1  ORF type:complete len:1049 (-),score=257.12 TRINITY_DN5351_c0_g1_i1:98-3244(-)
MLVLIRTTCSPRSFSRASLPRCSALKGSIAVASGRITCAAPSHSAGPLAAGGLDSCRHFAGRSSGSGGGKKGGEAAEFKDGNDKAEGASEETLTSAAGGAASRGAPAETQSSDASGSTASASSSSSSSSASPSSSGNPGPNTSALFALPLYRKPAFPGFYQIVQISEQEVLDFLFALRKNGQGEYLGGFMTKELPSTVAEADSDTADTTAVSASASQNLRRDAGRVQAVNDLEEVGTVLQVINLSQYPNINGGQVVVMPHRRIRRTKQVSAPSPNVALAAVHVEYLEEAKVHENDEEVKDLHKNIIAKMKELLKTSFLYNEQFEQVIRFYSLDNSLKVADLVAGMSSAPREELQAILCEDDLKERLRKVEVVVNKDLDFARMQSDIKKEVEKEVVGDQRKRMLMEQMKQIVKELGIEKDDKQSLIDQFRDAVKDKTLPEEASKVLEQELAKLGTLEPSSSEFNVCRTYLEWLTCLPWGQYSTENKQIKRAEEILNEDHYGLEDVKERILEHMAVSFLKESVQGKIMCMVGPPGVGKTSIGQSIARALDRKFYRFSVGGLSDVVEIRGHRRTYVGAMPGKLIQCLKQVQSSNPVVLIDEIDKLGRDFRGDPSSALLEVLDPEQNSTFRDHYLDVPVDLSRILFVCTANVIDTIPGPLLDRMEIIRIAGYVFEEKVAISKQYLIPQTEEASGVDPEKINIEEPALHKMISEYAREAGVRKLRQLLEKIMRKVALNLVRKKETDPEVNTITADTLTKYIGQPVHMTDRLYPGGTPPGVVMGLAWTSMGGATLYIEARGQLPRSWRHSGPQVEIITDEKPAAKEEPKEQLGHGGASPMKVTGQLGSVMNESSAISQSYARIFVREIDSSNSYLDVANVHLNVPEGATPKDGPSAGVTMATALVSLALDKPIRPDVAMTGELTLTGKVLKVGGIKEKAIAAKREGITTLCLPRQNEADYSELKDYLKEGMTAHFLDHYDDYYRLAFDEKEVPPLPFESRGLPAVTIVSPVEQKSSTQAESSEPAAGESRIPGDSAVPFPAVQPTVSTPTAPAA